MKKSVIYLLALVTVSMIVYASCRKNNETTPQSDLSTAYTIPVYAMGTFYFDGDHGVIGYKAEDSTNVVTNFDSTDFTFNSGDTIFHGKNFRIVHDLAYPEIAYLMFNGTAEYYDSKDNKTIKIKGNFALDLTYAEKGSFPAPPKKIKVEHKCKSYEGIFDFIMMCNCCQMMYKEGLIIGCECDCTWGICMYEKTITEEKPGYNSGLFSYNIYNRIIEK